MFHYRRGVVSPRATVYYTLKINRLDSIIWKLLFQSSKALRIWVKHNYIFLLLASK
jgi:hypothetical protein